MNQSNEPRLSILMVKEHYKDLWNLLNLVVVKVLVHHLRLDLSKKIMKKKNKNAFFLNVSLSVCLCDVSFIRVNKTKKIGFNLWALT